MISCLSYPNQDPNTIIFSLHHDSTNSRQFPPQSCLILPKQVIHVQESFIHPYYSPTEQSCDVALLKLNTSITFNERVKVGTILFISLRGLLSVYNTIYHCDVEKLNFIF